MKPREKRKPYYTTGELAKLCHVSPATIFRAVTTNQLKAMTTPGGHFRIAYEEVEDFLRKNNIPLPSASTPTLKKVLIIEDNPAELRLFRRVLASGSRYKIQYALSGYEAGFLTRSFEPHLILLDIFLGDVDGREVAKMVRSDPKLKHTKIVAITGERNSDEVKKIQEWGFDGFLQKPIDPQELQDTVAKFLN